MNGATTVGIVANPASGRDIRRLVAGASVFGNTEKGSMVYRLMVGLGAAGVERVLMMPGAAGISESLRHLLLANAARGREGQQLPELEVLDLRLQGDARDTAAAVEGMCAAGARALVVLGGDGTSRVAARRCGDTPLCALSTGTNNAFAEMREATVAGIAVGLVAAGAVQDVLRREKVLWVDLDGDARRDCALVDVAVTRERFVGARALWRAEDISQVFCTFASPLATGLSGLAGLVEPVPRSAPYGLQVCLAPPHGAEDTVRVPLAPGLIAPVGVAGVRRLQPGEEVEIAPFRGCLALDGEREIEIGARERVLVRLEQGGPLTVDVDAAMRQAALRGLLRQGP